MSIRDVALRFYLDEYVSHRLAGALRAIGYDAESVKERGAFGLSDARQLLSAVDLGRTLVTHNSKHYHLLHETLALWSRRWNVTTDTWHRGIVIVPHLPVPDLVRLLEDFANEQPEIDGRLFAWDRRQGWHEPL